MKRRSEEKMICEICNYSQKPDNTRVLRAHLESCEILLSQEKQVTVVWRTNQLTATLSPKENEKVIPLKVTIHETPPEPPIMVHTTYTPNAQQTGEVLLNDKSREA
jgi:hypothetical protein